MSSYTLYPPIVDSYMPAFKAETTCRVYFSLSKFNGSSDFKTVHAIVTKQGNGSNVVDKSTVYRSTGVILNLVATKVEGEDNLYYVDLLNEYISNGWTAGWIYKVQLRLANAIYDGSVLPSVWLNKNSDKFSEWSTVCTIKATGDIKYAFPNLGIDKDIDPSTIMVIEYNGSTLNLFGEFYREEDPSEIVNNYQFLLYDANNELLEDSGILYTSQYQNSDEFKYTFKTELIKDAFYKLTFRFETNNLYTGGFEKLSLQSIQTLIEEVDCKILTAEDFEESYSGDPNDSPSFNLNTNSTSGTESETSPHITSVFEEEEEGRIGLKLYSENDITFTGTLCVRRTDSLSNFRYWEDIKIITLENVEINTLELLYDYTAESGVWYKYGVQAVDANNNRSILIQTQPIIRDFNYSFLLGKGSKQLKLKFDNVMSSFKYQISDSVTETIGGKYPIITRNSATLYRTFPINGTISFWMDENELFTNRNEVYNSEDVAQLYRDYNSRKGISLYDYIYERDFRQKVLEFLQNGELKLFKSPTEGNIIVRLTEVSCSPNQSLGRMIYSFSATAYEMQDKTIDNYLKDGFMELGGTLNPDEGQGEPTEGGGGAFVITHKNIKYEKTEIPTLHFTEGSLTPDEEEGE